MSDGAEDEPHDTQFARMVSEDAILAEDAVGTAGRGDGLGFFASVASKASAIYVAARDSLSLTDSLASSHEENRRSGAPTTAPVHRIRVSERTAMNISQHNASNPATIQRARNAAGYHEDQQQATTSSNCTRTQHTGLASSDAERNNLADEMEEDSR
eukprot:scaffold74058_cov60-Attheya_sp.AAC.3